MNWSGICFPQGVNLASRFVFSSLAALLATGCSSSAPKQISEAKTGKVYAIVADSAAFYRYGPQQGNGPDSQLPRDTLVP